MPNTAQISRLNDFVQNVKYYSNISQILYKKTEEAIKRENLKKNIFLPDTPRSECSLTINELHGKVSFREYVDESYFSSKAGIVQPFVILFRTSLRCLILAYRIETLLCHGTLMDLKKWAFRSISFHDLTSSTCKRINNICISLFRISFAPAEILAMIAGSSAGVLFPGLGAQIRRDIYEFDQSLDLMEKKNRVEYIKLKTPQVELKKDKKEQTSESNTPTNPPSQNWKKVSYQEEMKEKQAQSIRGASVVEELTTKLEERKKDGSIPLQQ